MHSTDNGPETSGEAVNGRASVTVASIPTPVSVSSTITNTTSGAGIRECSGCGKRITERFLLKALDLYWHEDCLKCGCCDCRLGEVGSTLYTKANLILCKRDYLRLFGTTGYCAACNKVIPAFEMVMRAKSNVYHLECFACQQCNHRFCVGDRFYLCDNKILCEYDYEERLVFANMAYNPSSLAHIRRQVSNLQPANDNLNIVDEDKLLTSPSCYSEKNLMLRISPSQLPINIQQQQQQQQQQQLQQHHHHQHHHHHHHHHQNPQNQQQQQQQQQNHKDDGSSGYGSPDSEIFDAPLNQ